MLVFSEKGVPGHHQQSALPIMVVDENTIGSSSRTFAEHRERRGNAEARDKNRWPASPIFFIPRPHQRDPVGSERIIMQRFCLMFLSVAIPPSGTIYLFLHMHIDGGGN